MGKRKQKLMTGLTEKQRIKAAIKRKAEQRKEEAKQAAKVAKALIEQFTPMVGIPPGVGAPIEKWKSPEDLKRLNIEVNAEIDKDQVKLDALRKKFNVG